MKPSVSVLLPVYNAQHRLENEVAAILDVLAELTDRFDVLIVDDGSVDDTTDVAQQLAIVYPQVSTVRHPLRLGLAEAVQTGLDQTDGDILFVGDEQCGVDPEDMRRLWPLRSERGLVMARPPAAENPSAPWIAKLLAWTPKREQATTGVQMIRRREFDELRRADMSGERENRRIDPGASTARVEIPPRPIYLQKRRAPTDDRRRN